MSDVTQATTALEEISSFADLPIDIRAELDRRFLRLGDVLELVDGSVIPLSKPAGEPLDVFAGGVLLGAGEVNAVNEHFGVRITAFGAGSKKPSVAPFLGESDHDSQGHESGDIPLRAGDPGTLALLRRQMVCLSVVVGRTQMTLEKLVRLNTGSILELESLLKQPVEVLVNDQVLAYGEVVAVDGNYGVRILFAEDNGHRN